MKYLAKNEALCIGCKACEEVCSHTYFKENNPTKSRIRIHEDNGKYQIKTCTQCGVCTNECQIQALKTDSKGIVRLNKTDCVGCLICVGYCPEEAMMQHDSLIEPFKCIACGLCAKACPTGAIAIQES